MTEQIRRQRRETEQMEIVIEHTEMVGNSRECHGKAGEQSGMSREGRRTMEKVRENTVHDTRGIYPTPKAFSCFLSDRFFFVELLFYVSFSSFYLYFFLFINFRSPFLFLEMNFLQWMY